MSSVSCKWWTGYKYKYKIKTYNAPYVTRVIRRRGDWKNSSLKCILSFNPAHSLIHLNSMSIHKGWFKGACTVLFPFRISPCNRTLKSTYDYKKRVSLFSFLALFMPTVSSWRNISSLHNTSWHPPSWNYTPSAHYWGSWPHGRIYTTISIHKSSSLWRGQLEYLKCRTTIYCGLPKTPLEKAYNPPTLAKNKAVTYTCCFCDHRRLTMHLFYSDPQLVPVCYPSREPDLTFGSGYLAPNFFGTPGLDSLKICLHSSSSNVAYKVTFTLAWNMNWQYWSTSGWFARSNSH